MSVMQNIIIENQDVYKLNDFLILISSCIEELNELLINSQIDTSSYFLKWKADFSQIYNEKTLTVRLFSTYCVLFIVSLVLIKHYILLRVDRELLKKHAGNSLRNLITLTKQKISICGLNFLMYFDFLSNKFDGMSKSSMYLLDDIFKSLETIICRISITPENLLTVLVQKVLSKNVLHQRGEYYTPTLLVKEMVRFTYKFGTKVLDPSCGTGNFLLNIVKTIMSTKKSQDQKSKAIKRIWGFDINPIAIFFAKINILIVLQDKIPIKKLNLYCLNSLQPSQLSLKSKFDIVIGNPPWFTLRDIESPDMQIKLKKLAEDLNIKPSPKNVLNIEISTLFFYQCSRLYLKIGGIIFFVITKGIINGSHASKFRNFRGFKNINIWQFDKRCEKIFNIDFVCLYAEKNNKDINCKELKIPSFQYQLKKKKGDQSKVKKVLVLKNKKHLVPYSIEGSEDKQKVKKLIWKSDLVDLIPNETSYYKSLFHKGADLNPRNLIFIIPKSIDKYRVKIRTDPKILKRAKDPWKKIVFSNDIIEKDYLYKAIKSTELLNFHILGHYTVFLPLETITTPFDYDSLKINAKKSYDKINQIYIKLKKKTTKHQSLVENLNRWSKLINNRQNSKIKVVYNNSGSMLKSAVVKGDYIITGDLSFYDTNDPDEAYYLSAVLNSNVLTKQIKLRKSSRHIFKLPFEVPIKKYDATNKNHAKLSDLAKKGHKMVEKIINSYTNEVDKPLTTNKLSKILKSELQTLMSLIDTTLIKDLKI